MRKSTLITTIAMIVVVVVALSTATFAWFSSATNTIATANVSTTADVDWSITQATFTAPDLAASAVTEKSATLNGAAKNSITLNGSMLQGLFAPSAVLATKIASAQTTANVTGLADFYYAQINETGATVTCKEVYNGLTGGALKKMPDVIRVSNAKTGARTLMLNIVINVGTATDSTATLLAGSALRFYINGKYGAAGDITISNKYNFKTAVAKNATFSGNATANDPETILATDVLAYSDSATQWSTPGANEALGIGAGEYVKIYTIEIGEIAQGQGANFVIYTWLDGWSAGPEAAGANFTVKYAFTTKA